MRYFQAARAAVLAAAALVVFVSCTRTGTDHGADSAAAVQHTERARLLLLSGAAFPRESGAADFLAWEYGLAEEKGRVRVLYWPETFRRTDSSLRLVRETVREEQPDILITLGAPEGTLRELRAVREEFPDIRIVSIFPADDPLPVEAVSNLMIDQEVPAAVLSPDGDPALMPEEEAAADFSGREAAVLLLGAAFAMESGDLSATGSEILASGMQLAGTVAKEGGLIYPVPDWEFLPAADPETGIKSMKHVLIRKTEEAAQK